jgi:hypothetical protein
MGYNLVQAIMSTTNKNSQNLKECQSTNVLSERV